MKNFCLTTLISLAVVAVVSCQREEAEKLPAPSPMLVTAGQYDATFIWETVRNAEAYEFVLNDEAPLTVKGVSVTLENLEEATLRSHDLILFYLNNYSNALSNFLYNSFSKSRITRSYSNFCCSFLCCS